MVGFSGVGLGLSLELGRRRNGASQATAWMALFPSRKRKGYRRRNRSDRTRRMNAFSRRRFLYGAAAAAGTAAWAGAARAEDEAGETVVNSLVRPEAPPLPGAVPLAPPDRQPPHLDVPKPQRKLGWAVVGIGELTLGQILPAFGEAKKSKPVALVSGHPEKAKQVAEGYGVPGQSIYNYENFDSIRDNPDIDVVYIVLPNSMHAEYTVRGLEAGKHGSSARSGGGRRCRVLVPPFPLRQSCARTPRRTPPSASRRGRGSLAPV